ncbi:MAG: restriction endonuclease [Clostridia bacterium]|nr:restriction endonuclease [Clostridia bacterium]
MHIFSISQVDSLSGIDFELFLKQLFLKLGFNVELTKQSGDFGADLILTREKEVAVVQAKCYSKTVGAKAVQEALGSKNHYGATKVICCTNNYFSMEAIQLAEENGVDLIDREILKKLISKTNIIFERTQFKSTISNEEKGLIEAKYKFWI